MERIKRSRKMLAFLLVVGFLMVPGGALAEEPAVAFVEMTFGDITMLVPDVFGPVEETEGVYVSAGPAAGITVTTAMEIDLLPSEWDESLAADALEPLYGTVYTDMELSAFSGEFDLNGSIGVYMAFYGINQEGVDRLVQVVRLFNEDLTAQYQISFVHGAEDAFFTPEIADQIINSITLRVPVIGE